MKTLHSIPHEKKKPLPFFRLSNTVGDFTFRIGTTTHTIQNATVHITNSSNTTVV